jgi:hypothetical protein
MPAAAGYGYRRWTIIAAATLTLLACAQPNDQERTSMTGATQGATRLDTRPVLFGRFSIDVPTAMELQTQRYTVGRVALEDIASPVTDASFDSLWKAKRQTIAAEHNEDTKKTAKLVEETDLGRGSRALFYHGTQFSDAFWSVQALVRVDAAAIWLLIEDVKAPLDELKAEIANIAKSLSLGSPDEKGPGAAFSAGRWRVTIAPTSGEEAYVRFVRQADAADVPRELKIRTHVVEVVDERGLAERFSSLAGGLFAKLGVGTQTTRSGKRELAGLDGDEVIAKLKDDRSSMIGLKWEYHGTANAATKPAITIEAQSEDRNSDAVIRVWDKTLGSLRSTAPAGR